MTKQPPNDIESSWLTAEDRAVFESAREAMHQLKRTFERWTMVGHAVVRARAIANERGGRKTFQRLLMQQGLSEIVGDKGSLSRLEMIMAHLEEVGRWRFTLTERQKIDWAAPNTIARHCPVFRKVSDKPEDSEPALSPMARLKQKNDEASHKIADLEERLAAADAGSLLDLDKDSAKNIASVIFRNVGQAKAINIAKELTKLTNVVDAAKTRRRRSEKAARAGEVTR